MNVRAQKTIPVFFTVFLNLFLFEHRLLTSSMNVVHTPSHHLTQQQPTVQHDSSLGVSSIAKTGSKTKPSNNILTSASKTNSAVWNDLPFSVVLEPDERLVYSWDWNESANDDEPKVATIQVRAKINKQAWLAIGFSSDGSFSNADFCVLFSDMQSSDKRKMLLYDGWTDDDGVMHVDAQQDCRLLEAYFGTHAQLVLRYERAFDTCDDPFDYVIEVMKKDI